MELHQTSDNDGNTKRVARVVVWDAYPDFFFEAFGAQIPAVVAEQLLTEARSTIKIRKTVECNGDITTGGSDLIIA